MRITGNPGLALALAMGVCLAGCDRQAAPTQDAEETQAAPETKPGLTLANGKLVLPAVSDRPGVVYFTLTNGSDKPVTLAAVHVEGAEKAEMHVTEGGTMSPVEKVEIEPGKTAEFAPGGKHVMLFGLGDQLAAGGTTEMTLTFSDGDKLSTPVAIEAMGGDDGMAGMDHGAMH